MQWGTQILRNSPVEHQLYPENNKGPDRVTKYLDDKATPSGSGNRKEQQHNANDKKRKENDRTSRAFLQGSKHDKEYYIWIEEAMGLHGLV
jgi:hypothetical protein